VVVNWLIIRRQRPLRFLLDIEMGRRWVWQWVGDTPVKGGESPVVQWVRSAWFFVRLLTRAGRPLTDCLSAQQ
jgi:hypothetical protein